jgi:predicted alpha/beta-hydrolase family hydrolase
MTGAGELALTLGVEGSGTVSGLALGGDDCRAAYVFAHGAGAGMRHAFMAELATRLAARGVPPGRAPRTPRCALRSRQRTRAGRGCRSSPAASRSAAA